jgi:WXG100 family type VII secretion target
MRATIVVQPERLRQAAAAVRALRERVVEVRGQLAPTVVGVEPALGDGFAREAFDELWSRWSASAERLASSIAGLAAALEAAAEAYERADREGGPGERSPRSAPGDGPPRRPAVSVAGGEGSDAAAW